MSVLKLKKKQKQTINESAWQNVKSLLRCISVNENYILDKKSCMFRKGICCLYSYDRLNTVLIMKSV